MSTTLPESYIQEQAIEHLTQYYRKCSHNKKIEYEYEAYTKQNKRADGLIIWERAPNKVRVVSIEAKSATTIRNLLTRWDKEKISKGGFYVALIIATILFCIAYGVFNMRLPYDLPTLVLTFLILTVVWWATQWLLQTFFSRFFKTAGVLEQAARYPGNEVWIAIGVDTFTRDRAARLKELRTQCRLRKYGLLEIQIGNQAPVILERPKFNPIVKGIDFLSYYKKEPSLRKKIAGETKRFLPIRCISSAELNYWFRRQKISGIFALCFMSFNFFNLDMPFRPNQHHALIGPMEFSDVTPPPASVEPVIPTIEEPIVREEKVEEETSIPNTCTLPYDGKRFILIDKLVPTVAEAKSRVKLLKKAGCPGNGYFWIPCSDSKNQEEKWCVYAYSPRRREKPIEARKDSYQYLLRKAGLEKGMMDIWEVGVKEEGS